MRNRVRVCVQMRVRPPAKTRTCVHTYVYARDRTCMFVRKHTRVTVGHMSEKVAQVVKIGRETTIPATISPGFVMRLKFCTCFVCVHFSCRCCPRITFLFVHLHMHVMCAVPTCMSTHAHNCTCAPASIYRCYGRRMCQHRT